jgi:hypothetical protein
MHRRPQQAHNGSARTTPEEPPCHCPSGSGRCGPSTAGPRASSPSASTPSKSSSAATNPAAPSHPWPPSSAWPRHSASAPTTCSSTTPPAPVSLRRRRPRRPARHHRRTIRRRPRHGAVVPRRPRHQNPAQAPHRQLAPCPLLLPGCRQERRQVLPRLSDEAVNRGWCQVGAHPQVHIGFAIAFAHTDDIGPAYPPVRLDEGRPRARACRSDAHADPVGVLSRQGTAGSEYSKEPGMSEKACPTNRTSPSPAGSPSRLTPSSTWLAP